MTRIGRRPRWLAVALAASVGASVLGESPALGQQESWDAVYIAGNKVGYNRIGVETLKDKGRTLLRVRVDFNLSFKRGNDNVAIEVNYGTIETPEGQVLKLDTKTYASQTALRVHGDVVDGKMKLAIENGSQRQQKVIPWGPDVMGPYGPELSFSRNPIKPGEVRTLKTFVPDLNIVGVATLTAGTIEPIPLGGGAVRDLLKVVQKVNTEDGKRMESMDQTFWVDASGQVLKTRNDVFGGMETFRTTKEAAMRPAGQFDMLNASVIKVPRKITNPESSRDIVYKVTMTDADPTTLFPNDRRQTIKAGSDPKTATLQVKSAGPLDGPIQAEAIGAEYLRSNALITSTDLKVVALARRAVGQATDPWAKAQAINKWVHENMKNKNFETGFAPADEVARTLSGDCTEHGVLTAAMCRSEGIPARVVVGLVYAASLDGFGFHMWDEVYVNQRWVAIDSAFDETQVDAVHIKLSETSLDGVSPFETFLSVARVANKLKIEATEIR